MPLSNRHSKSIHAIRNSRRAHWQPPPVPKAEALLESIGSQNAYITTRRKPPKFKRRVRQSHGSVDDLTKT